jgi:glycosyltransferase involved in cell wall biosynthesis
MMRVAYVSMDAGVPVYGRKGCSVHAQEIIRALLKLGASVDLFAARVGGEAPADLASVRLHRLPAYAKTDAGAREACALAANRDLREMLEREGPFDLVYERYSLWSYAAMEWAREQGAPGALEVNAPLIEEQAAHRGLVNRHKAEEVAARVFAAARAIVAVSAEVARYVETFPSARGRVHVVPNGVNAERFEAHAQPTSPAPPGVFTVGFLGTLKPWHGLPTLAEAFALLHRQRPNTRLLVVGDGTERESFCADLKRRGVEQAAHLTGAVEPREAPGLLASMDVGVAPYADAPGFYFSPLKVYEYMAAELPVVASRVGQLASLIRDGETGLLCEPGDAVSLASTIAALIDDAPLRREIGRAARAHVLRRHTWDAAARRILDAASLTAQSVHAEAAS